MTDVLQTLRLRTFGTRSLTLVSTDGGEQLVLDVSKLLALVTYLAAAPRRSATRDHLTDLLWDNLEPDSARHALRHSRWQIHQKCQGLISIEGDSTLTLQTAIPWDRDDFLAAAASGDVLSAVQHYRGEFFPGFASPGSGEFERWLEVERVRLRSIFVRCGESVVMHWLSQGRARDAIALARRVRDTDPLHLTGWRLLLEALIAARDTLTASVEADALERLLAEHAIDTEPSVRTLLSVVRRQAMTPEQPSRPTSPLARLEMVGREREFAGLIQAWELAAQGNPTSILVNAPAGMGKTRLLRELSARLKSLHARHLTIPISRPSRDLDFSVVSDLCTRLASLPGARGVSMETARMLVALNPALASQFSVTHPSLPMTLEPVAVRSALKELLEAVSFERPVAVLLDDLHWCDNVSRHVIAGAIDGLDRKAVLLVATDRSGARRTDFVASARALPLAPLGPDSVWTLLGSVAAVPNEQWVTSLTSDLARFADGSPLLIIETLQLALERGALDLLDGEWCERDRPALATLLMSGSALRERVRQLSQSKRDVLRILAIADTAIDHHAIAISTSQDPLALARELDELELDGFVERNYTSWLLAHQEFGAAALADLDEPRVHGLELALGHALVDTADDLASKRRATVYLRAAGDWEGLASLFRDLVHSHSRQGVRRSPRDVAHELLGAATSRDEVARLMRTLPLLTRAGIVTPRQRFVAAAGTSLIMLTAVAAAFKLRQPPNEDLLFATAAEIRPDGETWLWEIAVDDVRRAQNSVPGRLLERARRRAVLHGTIGEVVPFSSKGGWVFERTSPDSGEVDLYYVTSESARERRLTETPGDDIQPDPSPDGRYIAYSTAAAHPLQHTDIAVLEVSSAHARVLTSGEESDRMPRWSPSGTQIAFLREYWDDRPVAVCLTALDARSPSCTPVVSADVKPSDLRWTDDDRIEITSPGHASTFQLEIRTRVIERLSLHRAIGDTRWDSNGEWLFCNCLMSTGGLPSRVLQLRHRNDDSTYALVDHDSSKRVVRALSFRRTRQDDRYLDGLTTVGDTAVAITGIPFAVGVGGYDAAGRPMNVQALTFLATDTSVATIDSTGVAMPRRPGTTSVTISAGGWRTRSMQLRVVPNDTTTLLDETWNHGISTPWRTFGVPAPVTLAVNSEHWALANSGDGRAVSGVYGVQPFDASRGLTLRTRLSTPVKLTQWQDQTIEFVDTYDLSALARWDHQTGYPWQEGRLPATPFARFCRIRFPGGPEGAGYAEAVSTFGSAFPPSRGLMKRMASGSWYDVVMQILPDGRCMVLIDNQIISLGTPAINVLRPFLLLLYGSSVNTRVLLGPLRVTRGIHADLEWRQLTSRAGSND